MFRSKESIFLLTYLPTYLIYLFSGRLHLMKEIVQSCVHWIMRVGVISINPLDFTPVELLFKINEYTMMVERRLTIGILFLNQKTQNRSQSVKLGSNKNELAHAILQHTDAMRTVQNPPAGYENLAGFEESGRKFIVADDTFRYKISGFMRKVLVYLDYNSKVAFYSLIDTIRFLQSIPSIFLTASIVRGPGF